MSYQNKYLKYKVKYAKLKKLYGGSTNDIEVSLSILVSHPLFKDHGRNPEQYYINNRDNIINIEYDRLNLLYKILAHSEWEHCIFNQPFYSQLSNKYRTIARYDLNTELNRLDQLHVLLTHQEFNHSILNDPPYIDAQGRRNYKDISIDRLFAELNRLNQLNSILISPLFNNSILNNPSYIDLDGNYNYRTINEDVLTRENTRLDELYRRV